jgi:3-oxoadipate enol-lactonase
VRALVLANSTGGIRDSELDVHFDAIKTWHPRQIWAGAYASDFPQREPTLAFLYQQVTAWNVRRPANLGAQLELVYSAAPIVAQRIPTLFLTGEDDILIPPRLVKRVAQQIPHAQFVTIPASGHSPYFERPEIWNRIVLDFLQG